jgi:hypothetical protein
MDEKKAEKLEINDGKKYGECNRRFPPVRKVAMCGRSN